MTGSFTLSLKRFATRTKADIHLAIRRNCFEIFARVVRRTPVDRGRARGNWLCSVSQAALEESGRLDRGGDATIAEMARALEGMRVGQVVFFTNTLPYILPLEYEGHSPQAPAGMVNVTLQEFPGIVADTAGGGRP